MYWVTPAPPPFLDGRCVFTFHSPFCLSVLSSSIAFPSAQYLFLRSTLCLSSHLHFLPIPYLIYQLSDPLFTLIFRPSFWTVVFVHNKGACLPRLLCVDGVQSAVSAVCDYCYTRIFVDIDWYMCILCNQSLTAPLLSVWRGDHFRVSFVCSLPIIVWECDSVFPVLLSYFSNRFTLPLSVCGSFL